MVLLAAIPGLMKFDLIFWWAGRLWGERIIHLFAGRSGRQQRRVQRFLAWVERWGRWFTWPAVVIAPFLPVPSAIIYAIAGWTAMSWVTFLILDIIGSLAWAGVLAGLGYALGQHAVSVAQDSVEVRPLDLDRDRCARDRRANAGRQGTGLAARAF